MTDLEMTVLCAEAMGLEGKEWSRLVGGPHHGCAARKDGQAGWFNFDPLHDDEQAMALIKKFQPDIESPFNKANQSWVVVSGGRGRAADKDINRAVVECVAKMQGVEQENLLSVISNLAEKFETGKIGSVLFSRQVLDVIKSKK